MSWGRVYCANCNIQLVEVIEPPFYKSEWLHKGITKLYKKCPSRAVATPYIGG